MSCYTNVSFFQHSQAIDKEKLTFLFMTFTPLIELKLRITVIVIYVAVDVESGKISLISGRSSTITAIQETYSVPPQGGSILLWCRFLVFKSFQRCLVSKLTQHISGSVNCKHHMELDVTELAVAWVHAFTVITWHVQIHTAVHPRVKRYLF